MSTALDAGVPGSNLFRGLFFFSSYFYLAQKEQAALFQLTVNSEVFAKFYFRETSHMQNFVKIKLSQNGEITLLFTCPSHKF